jgi:hypothetical protein
MTTSEMLALRIKLCQFFRYPIGASQVGTLCDAESQTDPGFYRKSV